MRAFVGSARVTLALLSVLVDGAAAQAADMSCQQVPGNRFYWVERAFCDLEPSGPEKARGLIVWNHGISGTLESYKAPAPLAFRLLQARGWDVIMIKRHNLAETMAGGPLDRKSTRLNSSHTVISYAVFCLKKKKKNKQNNIHTQKH